MRYKLFTTVGCDKCESVKQFLKDSSIDGNEINIADDEGVVELRKIYPQIKDKVERKEDGSLPIPLVLFFDDNNDIIGIKHNQEEVESFVNEKK